MEVAINERIKKIFDQLREQEKIYFFVINMSMKTYALKTRKQTTCFLKLRKFRKTQMIDLKKKWENNVKTSSFLSLKSVQYDLKSIKSHLILHLIHEKEGETSDIKNARHQT